MLASVARTSNRQVTPFRLAFSAPVGSVRSSPKSGRVSATFSASYTRWASCLQRHDERLAAGREVPAAQRRSPASARPQSVRRPWPKRWRARRPPTARRTYFHASLHASFEHASIRARMPDLYDRLIALPPDQWAVLRMRLRDLDPYLPAPTAPRAEQATALAGAAVRQGRLAEVSGELDRVTAFFGAGAGDVDTWLQCLRERHRQLRVIGLFIGDADQWLDLDDLFVDVDVVRAEGVRAEGTGILDPREAPLDTANDLESALAAVASIGRRGVVLVGLPGSGKTTLLQRAWCRAYDAWSADRSRPLPLLLRCATIQHLGADTLRPRDLGRIADMEAAAEGFRGAGSALLAEHRGPLLVLLDGLDELRTDEDRRRVASWVAAETGRWPGSTWVVTSRRAAWGVEERRRLVERLVPFDVLNLTSTAIDAYVRKWFPLAAREKAALASARLREEVQRRAGYDAEELLVRLRRAGSGERIRALTGNPLTLSTVCLVYRRFHELPRGRGTLYGYCLEVLLRGRYRPGPPEFDRADGVKLLHGLAWAMQSTSDDVRSPKEVPRDVVLASLGEARLLVSRLAEEQPEDLLHRLVADCGVLYTADHARYQFVHLTLQEFLAAEHARAKNLGGVLAASAGEARWREPILLSMAEPGLQSAFYTAVLNDGVAAHAEILAACLAEADPDPEPFVAFLSRSEARAEDLVAILRLFVAGVPPAVRGVASRLLAHPDPRVAELAAEVAGRPRPIQRRAPQAGDRLSVSALGMECVWIPPGTFWMGASAHGERNPDPQAEKCEASVHEVTLTRGFWLGRLPITIEQYGRCVDAGAAPAPRSFRRPGRDAPGMPVTEVSWQDALAYCTWASGAAEREVRLPTEAEWEYACRAGTTTPYACAEAELDAHAWTSRNAGGRLHVAGELRPNAWGLHDMHGNVWEWCADGYGPYSAGSVSDPAGAPSAAGRVVRGGSWGGGPAGARSAYRYWIHPGNRDVYLGFRVLLPAPA